MKRTLIFFATLFSILLFGTLPARADVNDFVINNFHGRYEIFDDTHGGRMRATENIELTYSDYNHGILRALPLKYDKNSLKLNIISVKRDGSSESYTTYDQNDNRVLQIGDGSRTITGQHSYEIIYEMTNIITFYDEYDEWFWDINGEQWGQPFEQVSGEVIFPENWHNIDQPEALCFTGHFGDTTSDCTVTENTRGYSFKTTRTLNPGETLSIVAAAPKGLFQPRTAADWWRENAVRILANVVPGVLIGGWAFNRWRHHGKDHKGRGIIVPEYGPPKDLSPAEVGMIVDYNVDNRDISATIIDLAIRKYIKIIAEKKKGFIRKSTKYHLELLKDDFSGLRQHEADILNGLFGGKKNYQSSVSDVGKYISAQIKTARQNKKITEEELSAIQTSIVTDESQIKPGATIELGELKNTFHVTASKVRTDLAEHLTKKGLYETNPRKAGNAMFAVAVVAGIIATLIHIAAIGLVAGAGVAVLLGLLMRRRSPAGIVAQEQIEGLKLYLKTAEADRIKMLQSPDAPYMPKGDAPKRTVELFEKLLPYAVVLGVEKDWAKQFEGIYTQPPDWYAGNWATFSAVNFASGLSDSVNAMNTNFSPPSNSGGSGFSGGGAGGGGGGGGGGGW